MAARPSKEVTAAREAAAWDLRTRELLTLQQIADRLDIDPSTVSRMLKRVGDRAAAGLKDRAVALKEEQLAQLDTVTAAAFQAWQAEPNPRLLTEIRGALADKRKILGLDAAQQQDITSGGQPITIREVVVEVDPRDG